MVDRISSKVEITYNPFQGLKRFWWGLAVVGLRLKSPIIPFRDWNKPWDFAQAIAGVEITYNPFQGLKQPQVKRALEACVEVEITYNPFQGLKLFRLNRTTPTLHVEITYNPFQGLKHSYQRSGSIIPAMLKSPIIPFRDWNWLKWVRQSLCLRLKSPIIPFRDWNYVRVDNLVKFILELKSPIIPFRDWNENLMGCRLVWDGWNHL